MKKVMYALMLCCLSRTLICSERCRNNNAKNLIIKMEKVSQDLESKTKQFVSYFEQQDIEKLKACCANVRQIEDTIHSLNQELKIEFGPNVSVQEFEEISSKGHRIMALFTRLLIQVENEGFQSQEAQSSLAQLSEKR